MKNILITGANGFVGKNLTAYFEGLEDIALFKYDVDNSMEDLENYVDKADFIFHLAGVNRPKEVSEFDEGNRSFTETLLDIHEKKECRAPIVLSSSIQAELENPYGISKRLAENAVFEYGKRIGIPTHVYRLPNVFGKWCRPNYNSVVATFCYNIANGLPIQINNPDTELNLVYIDDVIAEFDNALNGKANTDACGYCLVDRTFTVNLQRLADMIYSFVESRKSLMVPDFGNDFERFLYATYTSYLPEGSFGYNLDMKRDNRGWLAEFIKSKSFGQIFISRTKPGITRGNHWHHTKVEKFLVIEGEAVIKFRKVSSGEVIEYKVSGEELKVLDIPTGYSHSITNIGETDVITLFWCDELFNPQRLDTYYLEV